MQIGIECVHSSILLAYWLLRSKIEGAYRHDIHQFLLQACNI